MKKNDNYNVILDFVHILMLKYRCKNKTNAKNLSDDE